MAVTNANVRFMRRIIEVRRHSVNDAKKSAKILAIRFYGSARKFYGLVQKTFRVS